MKARRPCAMGLAIALAALASGCATRELAQRDLARLAGRTIVVTGASSGFGRGVALKLGDAKSNVVLAARRTELLEEVAAEIRSKGGEALVVTTDVASAEQVAKLAEAAVARFGRIDVWINDAAVGAIGAFWEIPVQDQARVVDVNLKGVIYGSHAALKQFRLQGSGTLVNIGSVESQVPLAYHATYAATKAAVLGLGRALNEELRLQGPRGVRVSTVMPWAADTPFFVHAANYSGGTPRMALMDGPGKVVNAIVRAALHPREEVLAGWKARAAYVSHRLLPDTTERASANVAHHYQFTTAPPAPATDGSLFQTTVRGRGVGSDVRLRMQQEDEKRRVKAAPR